MVNGFFLDEPNALLTRAIEEYNSKGSTNSTATSVVGASQKPAIASGADKASVAMSFYIRAK